MGFIKKCAHCGTTIMVEPSLLKRKKYCSIDCRDKSKRGKHLSPATEFKKGRRPHNRVPVGSESASQGYIRVKVAEPNLWRQRAHVVFEEANGEPLPDGWVLRHIDDDPMNDDLENLEPMPRSKHLQTMLEDPKILERLRESQSKTQKRRWRAIRAKKLEKFDTYYWETE